LLGPKFHAACCPQLHELKILLETSERDATSAGTKIAAERRGGGLGGTTPGGHSEGSVGGGKRKLRPLVISTPEKRLGETTEEGTRGVSSSFNSGTTGVVTATTARDIKHGSNASEATAVKSSSGDGAAPTVVVVAAAEVVAGGAADANIATEAAFHSKAKTTPNNPHTTVHTLTSKRKGKGSGGGDSDGEGNGLEGTSAANATGSDGSGSSGVGDAFVSSSPPQDIPNEVQNALAQAFWAQHPDLHRLAHFVVEKVVSNTSSEAIQLCVPEVVELAMDQLREDFAALSAAHSSKKNSRFDTVYAKKAGVALERATGDVTSRYMEGFGTEMTSRIHVALGALIPPTLDHTLTKILVNLTSQLGRSRLSMTIKVNVATEAKKQFRKRVLDSKGGLPPPSVPKPKQKSLAPALAPPSSAEATACLKLGPSMLSVLDAHNPPPITHDSAAEFMACAHLLRTIVGRQHSSFEPSTTETDQHGPWLADLYNYLSAVPNAKVEEWNRRCNAIMRDADGIIAVSASLQIAVKNITHDDDSGGCDVLDQNQMQDDDNSSDSNDAHSRSNGRGRRGHGTHAAAAVEPECVALLDLHQRILRWLVWCWPIEGVKLAGAFVPPPSEASVGSSTQAPRHCRNTASQHQHDKITAHEVLKKWKIAVETVIQSTAQLIRLLHLQRAVGAGPVGLCHGGSEKSAASAAAMMSPPFVSGTTNDAPFSVAALFTAPSPRTTKSSGGTVTSGDRKMPVSSAGADSSSNSSNADGATTVATAVQFGQALRYFWVAGSSGGRGRTSSPNFPQRKHGRVHWPLAYVIHHLLRSCGRGVVSDIEMQLVEVCHLVLPSHDRVEGLGVPGCTSAGFSNTPKWDVLATSSYICRHYHQIAPHHRLAAEKHDDYNVIGLAALEKVLYVGK
jgi:hypothetical protein